MKYLGNVDSLSFRVLIDAAEGCATSWQPRSLLVRQSIDDGLFIMDDGDSWVEVK